MHEQSDPDQGRNGRADVRGLRDGRGSAERQGQGLQRARDGARQPVTPVEGPDPVRQPGELHGREGQGRDVDRRPRPERGPGPRTGLEGLALRPRSGRRDLRHGRRQGRGGHPADLADARRHLAPRHPAHLSGTARPSPRSNVPSATSSPAAGVSTPRSRRCPSASTPAALSTATGRCPSARASR